MINREDYVKILEYYIKKKKRRFFDAIVTDFLDIKGEWDPEKIIIVDMGRYQKGLPLYGCGEIEVPKYEYKEISPEVRKICNGSMKLNPNVRVSEHAGTCKICGVGRTHCSIHGRYVCCDACAKLKNHGLSLNLMNMYGDAMYVGSVSFEPLLSTPCDFEDAMGYRYANIMSGVNKSYICDCDELKPNAYLFLLANKYVLVEDLNEFEYFKELPVKPQSDM